MAPNLTSIGHSFLRGCSSLAQIDLSSFGNVTRVDGWSFSGCSSLTSVDLLPMISVREFDAGGLLRECTKLSRVRLCPALLLDPGVEKTLKDLHQATAASFESVTSVGAVAA